MNFTDPLLLLAVMPFFVFIAFVVNNKCRRSICIYYSFFSLFVYSFFGFYVLFAFLTSILFNFFFYYFMVRRADLTKAAMIAGVAFNILFLAFFKYFYFIYGLFSLQPADVSFANWIILPLGISFFTFQQISILVDRALDRCPPMNAAEYFSFVLFFPKLVSGPIMRSRHYLDQVRAQLSPELHGEMIWRGCALFVIGLFKKVFLSSQMFDISNPVFVAAGRGHSIGAFDAWAGMLAYSLQIYFDFSGYSDMALGFALMIGIVLPLNFSSPYKSASFREFWRNWHISLSEFLRDYLFIPLGGSRAGRARTYVNYMVTMVLGGLWHGASLCFVAWGAIHGVLLCLSHMFRGAVLQRPLAVMATFLLVSFVWVPFRAENFEAAFAIWKGLTGAGGFMLPEQVQGLLPAFVKSSGLVEWRSTPLGEAGFKAAVVWVPLMLLWVFFLPASQSVAGVLPGAHERVSREGRSVFQGNSIVRQGWVWSFLLAAVFVFCILNLGAVSDFIYFEF